MSGFSEEPISLSKEAMSIGEAGYMAGKHSFACVYILLNCPYKQL